MMRSFLILLALVCLIVPAADAQSSSFSRLKDCIEQADEFTACEAFVGELVAEFDYCAEDMPCLVCLDFTPYYIGGGQPARYVGYDTRDSAQVWWYGLGYENTHNPLTPGEYEIRTSTSEGIWCDGTLFNLGETEGE